MGTIEIPAGDSEGEGFAKKTTDQSEPEPAILELELLFMASKEVYLLSSRSQALMVTTLTRT